MRNCKRGITSASETEKSRHDSKSRQVRLCAGPLNSTYREQAKILLSVSLSCARIKFIGFSLETQDLSPNGFATATCNYINTIETIELPTQKHRKRNPVWVSTRH